MCSRTRYWEKKVPSAATAICRMNSIDVTEDLWPEGTADHIGFTGTSLAFDPGPLIAHLRARPGRVSPPAGLADPEWVVSSVTVLEVWRGARDPEFEATSALVAACTVIDLTRDLAEQAGRLCVRMRMAGRMLGAPDAAIAATALAVGARLWTTNAKDLSDVPGLAVLPVVLT